MTQFLSMVPLLRMGSQFMLFAMIDSDRSEEPGSIVYYIESMVIQIFYVPATVLEDFGFLTDRIDLYNLITEPIKKFIIFSNLALNTICKIFGGFLLLHLFYRLIKAHLNILNTLPSIPSGVE